MADFGNDNPYYTGTVSLIANYKNGYADGNWKEVRSYKTRKKYFSYGKYTWDAFGPIKTMTINMNFKKGYIVGAANVNDGFANFKVTGSYDNNSLCTGTWIINDLGWGKNKELIYKDNCLYEFIARGNAGEVLEGSTKYQYNYDNLLKIKTMSASEREESGLILDTICGENSCPATNNLKSYFPKLLSVDYFLYEFIGGDLTFKEGGFKGGCEIQVNSTSYTPLTNISKYKEAEEFYNKNEIIKAYEKYSSIDVNKVKPSERKIVTDKIAILSPKVETLIEIYEKNDEFFGNARAYIRNKSDSLTADFKLLAKDFAIKKIYKTQKIDETRGYDVQIDPQGDYCTQPWKPNYNVMPDYHAKTALECLKKNSEFYEAYQRIITEYYYKYVLVLIDEERALKKESATYNGKNHSFYVNDKEKFISNISEAKKQYELSKRLIPIFINVEEKHKLLIDSTKINKSLTSKYLLIYNDLKIKYNTASTITECQNNLNLLNIKSDSALSLVKLDNLSIEKKNQVENLNSQTKKKVLYAKYIYVYNDVMVKYHSFSSFGDGTKYITELNIFSDKVITLYSQETKDLEKQLKDAETVEQIKTKILK